MLIFNYNISGLAFVDQPKELKEMAWGDSIEQLQVKGYELELIFQGSKINVAEYKLYLHGKDTKILGFEAETFRCRFEDDKLVNVSIVISDNDEQYLDKFADLYGTLKAQYGQPANVDLLNDAEGRLLILSASWLDEVTTLDMLAYDYTQPVSQRTGRLTLNFSPTIHNRD